MDLDLLAFDQLVETSMKVSARERLEDLHGMRLATQDEGKAYKKYITEVQKVANTGGNAPDGDDMVSDLAKAGNYK